MRLNFAEALTVCVRIKISRDHNLMRVNPFFDFFIFRRMSILVVVFIHNINTFCSNPKFTGCTFLVHIGNRLISLVATLFDSILPLLKTGMQRISHPIGDELLRHGFLIFHRLLRSFLSSISDTNPTVIFFVHLIDVLIQVVYDIRNKEMLIDFIAF